MSEEDQESKTEEATPERQRKAREEGQFPRSRDAGAVASSLGVLLTVLGLGPTVVSMIAEFSRRCFGAEGGILGMGLGRVAHDLGTTIAVAALPVGVAASILGAAMGMLEAGFNPNLELAGPKWERLDPLPKIQQMFSPTGNLANILLSLARVGVVGFVAWWVLKGAFPRLSAMARADLSSGVLEVLSVTFRLVASCIGVLAILSAADYGNSWYRHHKQIRMSRQEIKDELQQQEGDPKIKARQRARAREIAKRGLAKEMRKAMVVVANPTHISVALRYNPAEGAPVVCAKGYDEVALYIRKLAGDYQVPVIENRPLARALADRVRVGRAVPVDLFAAVAELLAIVYRMRGRNSLKLN